MGLSSSRAADAQTVTFGGGAAGQTGGGTKMTPPSTTTRTGGSPSTKSARPAAPTTSTSKASTTDAAAEVVEGAAAATDAEWTDRDKKLSESTTLTGGVGLMHMQFAQAGAPGQLQIGFTTEYFSAGFLCTPSFPCTFPRGSATKVTSDTLDHIGGHLTASATLLKFLEAYMATSAAASSTDRNRPSLLQVLGDSVLGLKAFGAVSPVLHAGGAAELWLVNGTGAVGLDGGGTGARFRGLATGDLRNLESKVPVRLGLSVGYTLDNSGTVIENVEKTRGEAAGGKGAAGIPITRIERFGLNVNRVDHADIGIGAETFVAGERVRPFVEYNIALPVNRQSYLCRRNNPSSDKCLADEPLTPSKLTLGARFLPWKRGFNVLLAFDIGATGTATFIEEVAPVAPWTLYVGAGWALDTEDRPPVEKVKTVEKIVEIKPPVRGRVKGFVHEEKKAEGVAGAIVSYDAHPEWTSLATGADGRFVTHEVDDGVYAFTIKADGYKPGACQTVIQQGQEIQLDCPLTGLPRVGSILGHTRDADANTPLPNATIRGMDGASKSFGGSSDGQGSFRFDMVAPGTTQLTAEAEGYLTLVVPVEVKARQDNPAELLLKKRPKNGLVQVGRTEITIKQQVQFAHDSSRILPESNQLLTEVADAIIHNPRVRRIEVQGHTDNTGASDHNKRLSEERADAVRAWLVAHGVGTERLVAKGYGETRPLVPNVTAGNKARNRRVQLIILDQDKK